MIRPLTDHDVSASTTNGAHGRANGFTPAFLLTPAPTTAIVGRERERALLHATLAQMLAGHGRLVLVGGEAGVGKTTLANDLARAAREHGALVLSGGCYDLSVTPPYGPWVDVLRRYPAPGEGDTASDRPALPELPAFLSEPQALAALGSQERMFTATIDVFRSVANIRPLLLILDDLQWADQVSLDLLRQFARDLHDLPLLVIVTYRTDELTRRHPLFQLLPFLVREARAERVLVQRLQDDAVVELLRSRYRLHAADEERLVTFLRGNAEGNPLFLHEVLRTLEDERLLTPPGATTASHAPDTDEPCWEVCDLTHVPLPVLIQQFIEVRLNHLDTAARDLLDIAAVIGHSVPLHEWQAVSGATDSELTHAMQAGLDAHLLRPARSGAHALADDSVEFTHALVREVLHDSIILPRRRALHRRVAEVLEQQLGGTPGADPDPDPDRMAYHYQQAGERAAVPWLVAAGERALRLYAWSTTVQRFDTAATLLERDGNATAAERGWLLYRAGRLQRYADPQRALDLLDAAERLAESVGDPVLAAFARFDHGIPLTALDQTPRAVALMEDALLPLLALTDADATEYRVDASWLADALAPRSQPCPTSLAQDRPGVITAAAIARTTTLATTMAQAGRFQEALDMASAFLARPDVQNGTIDIYAIADAHGALGQSLAGLGHVTEARASYAAERSRVDAAGHVLQVAENAVKELHHVALPYATDDVAEREQLAAAVERIYCSTVDSAPSGMPPRIAWVLPLILAGEWNAVQQLLALRGTQGQGRIPLVVMGDGAIIARHQGRHADAWALVRRAIPDGPVLNPTAMYHARLRHLAAHLALDANDQPTALAWIDVHEQCLLTGGVSEQLATAHTLRARYHWLANDLPTALYHAEAAVAQASDPRQPQALLQAQRLLGELLTATGNHAAAAEHLDAALALAIACQAPFEAALVQVAQAVLLLAPAGVDGLQPDAIARACAALDAAFEVANRLNADPTLTRIASLRAHAETLASRSAPVPDASAITANGAPRLTARETDVLRLVADGLTDSEVAERLFISPRTVSTHLTSIYTKLNVSSRTAATRVALDGRLI